MKTINLLKAAMLCIATLCAAGAMAQTPPQILGVYENVDEIIYQTTDKKLKLYVEVNGKRKNLLRRHLIRWYAWKEFDDLLMLLKKYITE